MEPTASVTHRAACRPRKKLLPEGELYELMVVLLRDGFSPEQIAFKRRRMKRHLFEDAYVCRDTIYYAIYALSVGMLRKELTQSSNKYLQASLWRS